MWEEKEYYKELDKNLDSRCGMFARDKNGGEITNIVKEVCGSRWADYVQLEASGMRGGIVSMWDKRVRDVEVSNVGAYSVSCSFLWKYADFKWYLIGVYAPNDRAESEETWWGLGAARGLMTGPWSHVGISTL